MGGLRREQRSLLSAEKVVRGGIEFHKLSDKEKDKFRIARRKEIDELVRLSAVRILSVAESRRFGDKYGDQQILPTLFTEKYKLQDDGSCIEKSRFCYVGWKDPQILQIERSASTPTAEGESAVLQTLASRKWRGKSKGVRQAFGHSNKSNRAKPIAGRQPPGGIEGLQAEQLILAETECYGLVGGPSWWRTTLVDAALALGMKQNHLEPCVLTLPPPPGDPRVDNLGVMLYSTDDILEGGGPEFQKIARELEKIFEFGKIVDLMVTKGNGTLIGGKRVRQLLDYSFTTNMQEYSNSLKPVAIARSLKDDKGQPRVLLDTELTVARGANGGVNWLSNQRPELSCATSTVAAQLSSSSPTTQAITDINFAIKQAKEIQYDLKVHAIPVPDIRLVAFYDASFDHNQVVDDHRCQLGKLVAVTDPRFNRGENAPMTVAFWKSQKMTTKCGSPLKSESSAALKAQQDLRWFGNLLDSILFEDFNLETEKPDHRPPLNQTRYVIRDDDPAWRDPPSMLVGDSKGVYDNLVRDQPGHDRDSAMTLALLRQHVRARGTRPRCLPHDKNPTDALTKFRGCHALPLLGLCRTGRFKLAPESEELEKRSAQKEASGTTYRPKIGARGANRQVRAAFQRRATSDFKQILYAELRDVLDGVTRPEPERSWGQSCYADSDCPEGENCAFLSPPDPNGNYEFPGFCIRPSGIFPEMAHQIPSDTVRAPAPARACTSDADCSGDYQDRREPPYDEWRCQNGACRGVYYCETPGHSSGPRTSAG